MEKNDLCGNTEISWTYLFIHVNYLVNILKNVTPLSFEILFVEYTAIIKTNMFFSGALMLLYNLGKTCD